MTIIGPLDLLCDGMIAYDTGDPKRIQHFMKGHSFAKLIAVSKQDLPDGIRKTAVQVDVQHGRRRIHTEQKERYYAALIQTALFLLV